MEQSVQLAVRCVWKLRLLEQPTTRPCATSAADNIPCSRPTEPAQVCIETLYACFILTPIFSYILCFTVYFVLIIVYISKIYHRRPFCIMSLILLHILCAIYCSLISFLQRGSIACYAKRCISYRKSVRLSVRLSDAGTVSKRLQLQSCGLHWRTAP